MRILIFRPGALGDLIVTFPMLQALRQLDPGGTIHVIAHPTHRALLRYGHGDADASSDEPSLGFLYTGEEGRSVVSFPRGAIPPPERWGETYDAAIIITRHAEDETMQTLRRLGVKRLFHCESCPPAGIPFREHLRRVAYDVFEIEDAKEKAGQAANSIWPFTRSARPMPHPEERRGVLRDGLILHAGAGGKMKQAPTRLFAHAARMAHSLDIPVAVLEGPTDREATMALLQATTQAGFPLHVFPVESPVAAALLLRHNRYFIGNDSGLTHLAAACGVRGIALFGPTDPLVWSPGGRILPLCSQGGFPEVALLENALERLFS